MTAQQIQQKRLQLGLSETQLAEKFGIDLNTLQLWESGLFSLPYPKLLELAFIALEGNWAISDEKEAEFARIRKLIDDTHKRMLETFLVTNVPAFSAILLLQAFNLILSK